MESVSVFPGEIAGKDGVSGASAKDTKAEKEGSIIASKNGSKYHFPWCVGAARIKESNKIWFSSEKEAKSAGYTPAKNCKGLK